MNNRPDNVVSRGVGAGATCRTRWLLLFLWAAGVLCPFYSLRVLSPRYGQIFNWVFQTHVSHVLMHAFLFATLAWLVLWVMSARTAGRRAALPTLALVLAVAVLQEGIQMLSEQASLGRDEVFDVGVDLAGGVLGLSLWWRFGRRRKS